MTIGEDITNQRQRHGRVVHLLHKLQEQRTEELRQETSMAHDISMHMNSFTGAVSSLVGIASMPFGFKLVEREIFSVPDEKMQTALRFILAYMLPNKE